ncbi:MAG TPA: orotidine 5'-phosphate decarboxylase [Nitrososphaerales archaeon]|nr:orotidine 5'-phosphate decarboxylase [Nitrososphaerales archaeon]
MKFKDAILRSAEAKRSRVVLALDFSDPYERRLERAERVLKATRGGIAAVKVNHHLLLPYGLRGISGIIETCRREELPLIADLKMNDIESTNLNIVDSLLAFGFDAVTANPFVGWEEGLGKVVERVHSEEGGIIFLVYMSHKGASEGYALRVEDGEPLYRKFAKRAKDWGADGVVVSAKSMDKLAETREIVGKDCLIFSPGIGAQGGDVRADVAPTADYIIVGRAVTEAPDPSKVLKELNGT